MFGFLKNLFKKEKTMGGDLEQTVAQKPPGPGGVKQGDTIIQHPPAVPAASPPQATVEPPPPPVQPPEPPQPPQGYLARQSLRFHINGPEVHFHDDANRLKAAMPVADWYTVRRDVLHMQTRKYVDTKFNTLLTLTPYIDGDTVEVYGVLQAIRVGRMLAALATLQR